MGEYAKYNGKEIKIGTCEDMYYLRFDQRKLVTALPGNVDPMKDVESIRFRFPFPGEDGIKPGAFDDHNRGACVNIERDAEAEDEYDHGTTQFQSQAGYLVSLPCPESKDGIVFAKREGLKIHRNGFSGNTRIVQQRYLNGVLMTVCQCGGCGCAYRLPTPAHAAPVVAACMAQAKLYWRDPAMVSYWTTIAERIVDGYRAK